MLAPRLAMLCKGTAWNQVRSIPAEKLTSAETGVTSLLEALASWEETEEMVTFEKFERALYKVLQKSDESTMSFTNRLNVAFSDLGDNVKLADFKAFILLRQSSLSNEDKRKILTMTGGKMEVKAIEQSMRSLATRILTGQNEPKKKVYPTNYIEEESSDLQDSLEPAWHAASTGYDEDIDDSDLVEQLASQGDSDALVIQSFEQDLEDLFQSTPDLQSALVSYQEARVKLSERKKFRGLRPSSAKGFHAKGKGKNKKGFMKGGSKSSLLERISKTNCKLCGERGHWRAECPNKNREAAANVVTSSSAVDVPDVEAQHVIVEAFDDVTSLNWSSFASVETCMFASNVRDNRVKTNGVRHNGVSWKEQAILFLSNRLSQRRTSALDDRNSKVLTDVRSEMHCAMSTTTDGSHAVLDTGASRSVIGAELVPALLKDLPSTVRDSVKQVPSKIGFRFGNNQVSYSHAQLQIPMRGPKKRVWLLVEIVKGSTPFLMSIHAMKCLGAQIDLSKNQVYLQNLQRTMNIHENSNGLFMVRLKELCEYQPGLTACTESVYTSQPLTASEVTRSVSDGVSSDCNAESSRHDPNHQGHFRAGDGEFEGPALLAGELGGDPQQCPASLRREIKPDAPTALRGSSADVQDRRDLHDAEELTKPSSTGIDGSSCGGLGSGMGGGISSDLNCTISDSVTSGKPCSPSTTSNACANVSKCSNGTSDEQCSERDTDRPGSQSKYRNMGSEVHQLGPQMAGSQVPGSVRERPGVCPMDSRSLPVPDATDARLLPLLPESPTTGTSWMNAKESSNLVQQDPCQLLLSAYITNTYEQSMMAKTLQDIKPKEKVDLIEVYAEADSKLAQAVKDLGGKSLRFTRADGDLGTREGQLKLLRMVFEHQPEHLWLAPECLPWCAWNKFNKNLSLSHWLDIHGKQQESREHLLFCSLLLKIQKENNRHAHMEHPDSSEAWSQPELETLVQNTLLARFDQCQMGLKHPQNHRFIRKRTAVRTTSHQMHLLLHERFCQGQHVHAQIAGSCKFRGKTVPVSRFAAFYPSGLAKRIAKCIVKTKHTMVDCPVLHIEEIGDIDPRPAKKARTNETEEMPEISQEAIPEENTTHAARRVRKSALKAKPNESLPVKSEHPWAPVFHMMRSSLPRVGAKEFRAGDPEHGLITSLCNDMNILQIKGCKGVERFLVGDPNACLRRTVVLKRFDQKIMDLGVDNLAEMSHNNQRRKAVPSHIMICVFGNVKETSSSSHSDLQMPEPRGITSSSDEVPVMPVEPPMPDSVMEPRVSSHADTPVSSSRPKTAAFTTL
eukprot:s436_g9.t2